MKPVAINDNRPILPAQTEPSRLAWIVAVILVIIQQDAFVSTPLILRDYSVTALRDTQNPFNTVAIAISILLIGIACFSRIRQVGSLALNNRFSLLFTFIVIASAAWSIHPDLTIRRGVGYILTMFIAAYLSLRFDVVDRMKVLSCSFAISAVGSLVFIAAFPQHGIMQVSDLAGTWRGVFPHKNVLGPVMAIAVFTELFVLVAGKGRPRWRMALLGVYLGLVLLSRSATALLLSLAFLAGTCIYLVWRPGRLMGAYFSILAILLVLAALILFWSDPDLALGILGKDTGLTGRTALWSAVVPLIEQRPVLGWGYRALWQAGDAYAAQVPQMAGWGAGSSHNSFLEITLQLGLVGTAVIIGIVIIALSRSVRCCKSGVRPLGWFSLMFCLAMLFAGQTMEMFGQNQNITWLIFNVLTFSCGMSLASCGNRVSLVNVHTGSSIH
jgi:O-antigen ligase